MFDVTPMRVAPGVFSFVGDTAMAARLAALHRTEPGPALVAELDTLTGTELPPLGRVRVLAAWDRAEAWLAARKQTAIVAVAGPTRVGTDDWGREEVAACLRLTPGAATYRVKFARQLHGRLAATQSALLAGEATIWQALSLFDKVTHLSDASVAWVERRVLPRAWQQTLPQFKASVARAVIAADTRTADERHLDAADGRSVDVIPGHDGMTTTITTQPAADAAIVDLAIDTLAREIRTPSDRRTLPQRRADALTELARRYLAGTLTTVHGNPVTSHVTVDLPTLLGFADNPAHLAGYGAITAEVARHLAKTGLWRWVLTDPDTGVVLDSTTAHDPGRHLTDLIVTRYPTCTAVGCHRPSIRCDLDHNLRHPDGPTCECNLAPLCRRHHRMKHEAGWVLQHLPDHTLRWSTPAGEIYIEPPPAIGPPREGPGPDPDYEPPIYRCAHPDLPDRSSRTPRSLADLEPPF